MLRIAVNYTQTQCTSKERHSTECFWFEFASIYRLNIKNISIPETDFRNPFPPCLPLLWTVCVCVCVSFILQNLSHSTFLTNPRSFIHDSNNVLCSPPQVLVNPLYKCLQFRSDSHKIICGKSAKVTQQAWAKNRVWISWLASTCVYT